MTKRIVLIGILVVVFLLGGWLTYLYMRPDPPPTESATVLLEKIREVVKLTTVEGEFTEIYSYNDYSGYFSWFWDKKALVRVQAVVAVGYDLGNLKMEVDSARHVVRIGPLPEPQILSIDHTLDYYDVTTGVFTEFSPQDYNRMNQKAKYLIREKALQSELLPSARAQSGRIFETVRFMAENTGWEVQIIPSGGSNTLN